MLLLKLVKVRWFCGGRKINPSLSYSPIILQLILLLVNLFVDQVSSQWTQVHFNAQDPSNQKNYPTVNKCCPLDQSYENGQCVNTIGMTMDQYWVPPKSIVDVNNVTDSVIINTTMDNPVVFRLQVAQPNCSSGVIEKIILRDPPRMRRNLKEVEQENLDDFDRNQPDVELSTEGYLIWKDDDNFMNIYHENFCIDQVNKTAYIAVLCRPSCTEENPCIRKCCASDWLLVNDSCERTNVSWKPHLYDSSYNRVTSETLKPHYVVGIPHCSNMYSVNMREDMEKFYMLLNGSLVTSQDDDKVLFQPTKFCIDGTLYDGQWGYSGHESDQIALICLPEEEDVKQEDGWIFILYASVMFVSTFFLILTASVYLILWEYQTIHGWLQFSYVVSLLFAYSFLASIQLLADTLHTGSPQICEFIGVVIHFSFLSAFFWLSSMNFDLWWTFSGCRPLRAVTRTGEKARFAFFGLLSWGGAILIASIGLTLDTIYKGDKSSISEFLPKFGTKKCYFHNELSKIPFFYAPVGFLFCLNFILFLSTICSLHKLQKDTQFATRQSSKQDKKRFVLFMKLFIVMGVCWIFEVISGISEVCSPEQKDKLRRAFLFTDILNALQGFFIFLIFTCKPNTCKQLEGQFKKLSVRLEEKRDSTIGSSVNEQVSRFFVIGFCAVILPGVYGLRKLFSYCGRPTRKFLEGRRNTSHNTVISTFEKSRKASDSSACTTLSVIDTGGAYEMDNKY